MNNKRSDLQMKLFVAGLVIKNLLEQVSDIENDIAAPIETRLQKIKKIKDEMSKVGVEIDNIKREITLLNANQLN